MGAAQPVAITRMLGGVCLIAEVDAEKARAAPARGSRRPRQPTTSTRRSTRRWPRAPPASRCAVAVTVNAAELLEGLLARDVTPDVVTDLTVRPRPAHRLPAGRRQRGAGRRTAPRRPGQARGAGAGDDGPPRASDARAARAGRGDVRLRQQHPPPRGDRRSARGADHRHLHRALHPAAVLPAASGRFAGSACRARTPTWKPSTSSASSCSPTSSGSRPGSALAGAHVIRQGLPARIAWLGHGERARLALAVNDAVADGRLRGAGRVHPRPHGRRAR